MGYGLGVFLLAIGLILVFAIDDTQVGPVEVVTVGWILAAAGVLVLALTAISLNGGRRRNETVARTTHPDGSQTVQERSTRDDGL